jgi:maltose alpha-D-glucosyltransferase/alpha-amylase
MSGAPWWKNAVFYGVDVGCFHDGNGDGVGDLAGLTRQLGYLAELGVTCLWLLPFYPSSERDNGYDVTDYYGVDGRYGSLDDFVTLLHRAGEHSIRVVLDLVTQHTSDRHPWFQAARRNEKSRYRDYYLWAHHPPPVPPGKGPMFPGQEESAWTYDEVARAYYYHRFYRFEPGLNAFNADVRDEIKRVMDYWLSFGIAGFRIDAASHMVEVPPVPGLQDVPPDTHDLLREMHGAAKQVKPDAMLLGEVDKAPTALARFFDGTQLDTLYNFLLDNYLLLALAVQRAEPIQRVFGMLPRPPAEGQWVNFLRNLDEADLEQLPRDEMQKTLEILAPEPGMRIYGRGARRRLAPMLGDDVRRLKMAWSLLFSLPGAPLFVYGDEIGLGDDLRRPGRNAVRVPMPWSTVEKQRADSGSLFSFMKRLIALRRRYDAIGEGRWHPLGVGAPSVLAHRYAMAGEDLVLLHNLGDGKVRSDISLDTGDGRRFETLLGAAALSPKAGRCEVELEPYACAWLRQHA